MFELSQALATETPRRIVIFDMPPLLLSDDELRRSPLPRLIACQL
jgi:hypothetical protein